MARLALIRNVLLAGVLALGLAASVACGGDDGGGGAKGTPAAPGEVKVTDKQDGQDVRLAKGGKLIVSLDSNHTTGFAWKVADGAAPALAAQFEQRYDAPQTGLAGSGGTEVYTFTAAS